MTGVNPNLDPAPDDKFAPNHGTERSPNIIAFQIANRRDPDFLRKIINGAIELGRVGYDAVEISPSIRNLLAQCAIIECTDRKSAHNEINNYPIFTDDIPHHQELLKALERRSLRITYDAIAGWVAQDDEFNDRAAACDFDPTVPVETLYNTIHQLQQKLSEAHQWALPTTDGSYLQLTKPGINIQARLQYISTSAQELVFQNLFEAHRSKLFPDSMQADTFVGHMVEIIDLATPERDLRKLFLAICDRTLHHTSFDGWLKEMRIEHKIGDYLSGDATTSAEALEYLRSSESGKGRYGPPPYFRNDPRYEETLADFRRINIRARNEAFSFHYLAQETKRLPDGSPSLFQRYATETFENVQGVHTSDMNVPPGGGLFMTAPRLDKLFFQSAREDQHGRLLTSDDSWFSPAIEYFEDSSYIFIRGDKIVIHNDPFFQIDKIPYAYMALNDHQNSSYRHGVLLPVKLVVERIGKCLYELDEGPLEDTGDLSKCYFTVERLTDACTMTEGKVLNLTGISALFCGGSYAFPPLSHPHFSWEGMPRNLSTLWKDAEGHVHSSYRVWNYRDESEQVKTVLNPLQILGERVSQVANRYQQLLGLFQNRYTAWKNDQVPGKVTRTPLMLKEAYHYHHALRGNDRAPVLCLLDRLRGSAQPKPLIDCKTMELTVNGRHFQMPQGSDGSRSERKLWKNHVEPLLFDSQSPIPREGQYELVMMERRYLNGPH